MAQYESSDDFSGAYVIAGWRGVAWHILGYLAEPDEDTEWSGLLQVDRERVVAVMVGDDQHHVVDIGDIESLDREAYCGECGQIGCGHE